MFMVHLSLWMIMDTIVEKQGNSCWMLLVPKDTVFVDDQKFYVFGDDFGQPPGA